MEIVKSDELTRLEMAVDKAKTAIIDGANALLRIRDGGLYKISHNSFEKYCNERFGIGRARAYQLIDMARHVDEVAGDVGIDAGDLSERQFRELKPLDTKQRRDVWNEAELADGGTPSGAALARMSEQNPLLSSKSNEWYTPAAIIESARAAMGSIDLDPASCEMANEIVRANDYFTIDDDGLTKEWHGNVWLNPPYGKDEKRKKGNKALWTREVIDRFNRGEIMSACVLVTNSTCEKWFQPIWDFPVCFMHRRIKFETGTVVQTNQPTVGTVVFYLGNNPAAFIREFRQHGHIVLSHGNALGIGAG